MKATDRVPPLNNKHTTLEHMVAMLPAGAIDKLRADGRELIRLLHSLGAPKPTAPVLPLADSTHQPAAQG